MDGECACLLLPARSLQLGFSPLVRASESARGAREGEGESELNSTDLHDAHDGCFDGHCPVLLDAFRVVRVVQTRLHHGPGTHCLGGCRHEASRGGRGGAVRTMGMRTFSILLWNFGAAKKMSVGLIALLWRAARRTHFQATQERKIHPQHRKTRQDADAMQ